ncbi:hypothetical protein C2E23DRAFT_860968 [Lenzites betulinus]|nr:hypothetical protein C2E23DRAFT_860968 [Lenzites betulinus]
MHTKGEDSPRAATPRCWVARLNAGRRGAASAWRRWSVWQRVSLRRGHRTRAGRSGLRLVPSAWTVRGALRRGPKRQPPGHPASSVEPLGIDAHRKENSSRGSHLARAPVWQQVDVQILELRAEARTGSAAPRRGGLLLPGATRGAENVLELSE